MFRMPTSQWGSGVSFLDDLVLAESSQTVRKDLRLTVFFLPALTEHPLTML